MTRRNEFSTQTKRDAHERSKVDGVSICECHRLAAAGIPGFPAEGCGRPTGPGNIYYEHINPDAICGRNDLDNAAVLTKTCWRLKTDTYDKPVIAKSNRVRDRARGIRPSQYRPLPGTFASGVKLPLRPFARPVDRRTGREM